MSHTNFHSLPRFFRLQDHQPFAADPNAEPVPLRKASLAATDSTRRCVTTGRTKASSMSSTSSDDTFVNWDANPSSAGHDNLVTTSPHTLNLPSQDQNDDNDTQLTGSIAALPDLPSDLHVLSRDDLESLARSLLANSRRARLAAISEQEKNKKLENKLDKLRTESIRRQRHLMEAVEKRGRELAVAKVEAASLRNRLGQVMSLLSSVIPGLLPQNSAC